MANDADQILIAGTGSVWVAPLGVSLPDDLDTAMGTIDPDWRELGYITEDGATIAGAREMFEVSAWQSETPVRRKPQSSTFTIAFELLQWSFANLQFAMGGGAVTEPDPGIAQFDLPEPGSVDEFALTLEVVDEDFVRRVVAGRGTVTPEVESQMTRTAAAVLPVTFSAQPATGETTAAFILSNHPDDLPAGS